ncbi:MAG: hypothetical protein GWP91_24845 [Rhodobacterales bacterium]|nr:hypothetical protein [Rhodobacterales bacterium]
MNLFATHTSGSATISGLMVLSLVLGGCIPDLPTPDAPCEMWESPGLFSVVLRQDEGPKRRTWVWVPKSEGPRPLVVSLHGGGGDHNTISQSTQLIALSNQEGFVVAFPEGLGFVDNVWNAGSCCGSSDEDRKDVDDVTFLDDLAVEIGSRTCGADVLAQGFSNGGMMSHRWACEGQTVDGLLPASGTLLTSKCEGVPVPIRHYHGENDPSVPYEGGMGRKEEVGIVTSVPDTMAIWRIRNKCTDDEPTVVVDGDTTCTAWSCEVPTEMCIVENWAHTYPGGRNRNGKQHDATTDGWQWFREARDLP